LVTTNVSRVLWTAVALVLIGLTPAGAREIQTAFEQTLAVRELRPQARDLADRFFFAIPAADDAVRVGSMEPPNWPLR
jgi:hypothetical protein